MEMVYSALNNSFFAKNDVEKYEEAGWKLADVVDVTYDAYLEFIEDRTLQGKVRIAGDDGLPAWGGIPPKPNYELRRAALARLSSIYQGDIEKLNLAWLASAVSDGINETTKKDSVLAQINARKEKYTSDKTAIISQYPD